MMGISINDDFHLHYAALVHLEHLEGDVGMGNLLIDRGKFTLYLKQQSRQSVGIALDILKHFTVDVQRLIEIAEQRLALEDICIAIESDEILFVLVIFVVDLTNYFL